MNTESTKKSGRSNNAIAALVILIGISALAAIIIFSVSKTTPEDSYFNPKKKATAQKLYTELVGNSAESAQDSSEENSEENSDENLDENSEAASEENKDYPQTPEEVVELYLKGTRLLYGDMINDEAVIPFILRAQREMYTDELIESTPLENQEIIVKEDIKELKEANAYITECTTQPVIFYENDLTKGYVRVTLEDNGGGKHYWKYYLKRDDNGYWKIEGIKKSNESFTE